MTIPTLSIILPTYNGARYLGEQIGSILAQDDGDFELLVTDDGSTDDSVALVEALAATDRRVRVLPSTGRLGQANRLRMLAEAARGRFLAVSDQDDIWAPDRNRRLLAAIGDRAMALGRSELIDGAGVAVGTSLLAKLGRHPVPDMRLRALIEPMFSGHATIVRRSAVNMAAFASPLTFDWLMALDAIFTDGLVYVDDAVVLHRIHGGNQLNNLDLSGQGRRLSSAFLRDVLLHQRPARLHLWLVLGYLGRSPLLAPDDRALFARLADGCYVVWFSHWRTVKPVATALRRDLGELRRFAGSDADWAVFADRVDLLTAPLLSPTGVRETVRRWRQGP